jgi:hypothetical protein
MNCRVSAHPRVGAYYAGHVGIALQAQDTVSCNVLAQLIQVLERMKADIGPNDAVDVEACSYAYIEKFALKIFAAADKEDREGKGDEWVIFVSSGDYELTNSRLG